MKALGNRRFFYGVLPFHFRKLLQGKPTGSQKNRKKHLRSQITTYTFVVK